MYQNINYVINKNPVMHTQILKHKLYFETIIMF